VWKKDVKVVVNTEQNAHILLNINKKINKLLIIEGRRKRYAS